MSTELDESVGQWLRLKLREDPDMEQEFATRAELRAWVGDHIKEMSEGISDPDQYGPAGTFLRRLLRENLSLAGVMASAALRDWKPAPVP